MGWKDQRDGFEYWKLARNYDDCDEWIVLRHGVGSNEVFDSDRKHFQHQPTKPTSSTRETTPERHRYHQSSRSFMNSHDGAFITSHHEPPLHGYLRAAHNLDIAPDIASDDCILICNDQLVLRLIDSIRGLGRGLLLASGGG